jgi:hypothetical protein
MKRKAAETSKEQGKVHGKAGVARHGHALRQMREAYPELEPIVARKQLLNLRCGSSPNSTTSPPRACPSDSMKP